MSPHLWELAHNAGVKTHAEKMILIPAHKYANWPTIKSVLLVRLKCKQVIAAFDFKPNLRIERTPRIIINGEKLQCTAVVLAKYVDELSE